jgi:hypothetical protein
MVQRNLELFIFTKFKEHHPNFLAGAVSHDDKPDFRVQGSDGILGIEITKFYSQPANTGIYPRQQCESDKQKILRSAKERFDRSSSPSVNAFVYFDSNFKCMSSQVGPIAERLSGLASQTVATHAGRKLWRREEVAVEGIHSIEIDSPFLRTSYWRAPYSGFVPTVKHSQIQAILTEKSNRSQVYRRNCNRLWLVIFMDRFDPASFALMPDDFASSVFVHAFDAAFLFFYDYVDRQKPPIPLRGSKKTS